MANSTVALDRKGPLQDAARCAVDRLFDALATLEAARAVGSIGTGNTEDESTRVRRLVGLADECIREVVDDLTPFV